MDEGGVFESLKAERPPHQRLPGLSGLPAGAASPTTHSHPSLVLGTAGGGDVFLQMPASREEGGGAWRGRYHHHRQPHHHFHHGSHRGGSLLQHVGEDHAHTRRRQAMSSLGHQPQPCQS